MILRKPYAILIKNFKLIHLIMAFFMVYLFYKTNSILTFLTDYLNSIATTITNEVTTSLFGTMQNVSIWVIIISSIIILCLMWMKEKPTKFYFYNILNYILLAIYFYFAYDIIRSLETGLVDVKTLKMLHDLCIITLLTQGIGLVMVIVRATGFDIKSFNFKQDLEELNIEVSDSEEFEVQMDIDTNKLKRNINKRIRHTKYIYLENKLLINILAVIVIAVISILVYLNISVFNRTYDLNQTFKTNQFIFNFENSYITKYDYKNKTLKEGYELVVLRVKMNSIYGDRTLNIGRFVLDIEGYKYYHNTNYKDSIVDFGECYNNQTISQEQTEYILVFEIPEKREKQEMILTYTDTDNSVIKIDVNPINLNKTEQVSVSSIAEELDLSKSILKNSKVIINNYEIAKAFKLDYSYCIDNNCIDSYEYLRPTTGDGYLLKLSGNVILEKNIKFNTLFKFIEAFGKIKYEKNDEIKTYNLPLQEVKSKKTTTNDIYIEITNEIANSNKIYIEFNIRGKIYIYSVK